MEIVEVGPRDGLQNEKKVLSTAEKVAYIELLIRAGLRRIEAVSFARADKVPQMADAEAVMEALPRSEDVSYIGLVMNDRGLSRAILTEVDEVNFVIVTTDTFSKRNQGTTVDEALRQLAPMVGRAKEAEIKTSVTVAASFGCPFEGEVTTEQVMRVVKAANDLGVDEIALGDTIGVGTPSDVRRLISAARAITGTKLRLHLHNTRNTGYANAITGYEMGVEALDSAAGGIGGCPFAPNATGNIGTEDLFYLLSRSGVSLDIDFEKLVEASLFITDRLEISAPAQLSRAGLFPSMSPR
ncbi:MAG: hydroxymethylglutaryl-CoA lyase [Actinomycetota bacterium]|nr:hydroxymethylglutaryl-CoA lyase [Actinomycetota bacterium]